MGGLTPYHPFVLPIIEGNFHCCRKIRITHFGVGSTITAKMIVHKRHRFNRRIFSSCPSVNGNNLPFRLSIIIIIFHQYIMTIKNNIITGGAGYGVKTEEDGAVVTIQYNYIYSNNSYAIQSTASSQDCKYNWYGSVTGPAYTALSSGATITKSNPNGTGNKISDYVTYYPWLHKSKVDVVNDNVSYQTSTMQLVAGWNTLSTPVKLISTADSIDELIPAGMTIGYYYDGGWQQITTGKVLNTCDAVYVRMSTAKYVQFKFDTGAFSTPSKDLAAGWNLVGLAYLSSAGKIADDAVASVAKTAANLPGYAQVVSPSINLTQKDMYGNTGTSWAVAYGQTDVADVMYAGLGYWVSMQNAATLAGFEITPIAPNLT